MDVAVTRRKMKTNVLDKGGLKLAQNLWRDPTQHLTNYDCYRLYSAINQHFCTNPKKYDFGEHDGQVYNVSSKSYNSERNKGLRPLFDTLENFTDHQFDRIIAQYVYQNEKPKVFDFIDNKKEESYYRRLKAIENFRYTFWNDLGNLKPNFNENFKTEVGRDPFIIKELLHKDKISFETFTVLVHTIPDCVKLWKDKGIPSDDSVAKAVKYWYFLRNDKRLKTELVNIEQRIYDFFEKKQNEDI